MTYGDGQGVGGVEEFRHFVEGENIHQHFGDLFFGGVTVASDGLLDFLRRVFDDGNIAGQCSCHGDPLRAAQLQHGLHVFAKKGRFERDFVGVIFVDQAGDAFKNLPELQLMPGVFAEVDNAKLQQDNLATAHFDEAIAHHIRAGVDAENNFFFHHFSHVPKLGSIIKFLKLQRMALLVLGLVSLYGLLLVCLWQGWGRATRRLAPMHTSEKVTVLVPFRNEAHALPSLIPSLQHQDYPDFEVLLIDDHSEDDSVAIARQCIGDDARFRLLTSTGQGKKAALTTGVHLAAGTWVVTTDADCVHAPAWLSSLSQAFTASASLVMGGVRVVGLGWWSSLQTIEFASVVGTGAAFAAWGKPIFCNGANLAFRRAVFLAVNGYAGNEHIASGDDEFLMRKVLQHDPTGVVYAGGTDAIVSTNPSSSIRSFLRQRIRWAGKWRVNTSATSRMVALGVWCFHLMIIMTWMALLQGAGWAAIALGIKMLGEGLFLRRVCRDLQAPWHVGAFIALQVLHPIYVVMVGIVSLWRRVDWKGRQV